MPVIVIRRHDRRSPFPENGPVALAETTACPVCGGAIESASFECPHCGERLKGDASLPSDPADLRAERDRLIASRQQHNRLGFGLGLPGLLLLFAGSGLQAVPDVEPIIGLAIRALGSLLLIVGLYYVALYKGRNGAWALLGFIGCIGLLILLVLKDYNKQRLAQIEKQLAMADQNSPPTV
jgi:hypothetical protein